MEQVEVVDRDRGAQPEDLQHARQADPDLTRRAHDPEARQPLPGVDLAARQLELARANVPGASYVQADMTALDLPPEGLDAVTAFYSLTHLPQAELPGLLAAIQLWLRPGGVFIASLGADASPDEVEDDWLGVPMFFGHPGAKRNLAHLRAAGFEVETAVIEQEPEDRHDARFLWVVARTRTEAAP